MNNPNFLSSRFPNFYGRLIQLRKNLKENIEVWHLFFVAALILMHLLVSYFDIPFETQIVKYFTSGVALLGIASFIMSLILRKVSEMLAPVALLFAMALLLHLDIAHLGIRQCILALPLLLLACNLLVFIVKMTKKKRETF